MSPGAPPTGTQRAKSGVHDGMPSKTHLENIPANETGGGRNTFIRRLPQLAVDLAC